jgi:uncharacterized protein (TIGR02118 family)
MRTGTSQEHERDHERKLAGTQANHTIGVTCRTQTATVSDMIRVSVSYPKSDTATFDHGYYAATHVPLAVAAWSPKSTEIDKGVNGPNEAAVHFTFDSLEAFQAAMGKPETQGVMADVPNYTNITPVMQISEIVG